MSVDKYQIRAEYLVAKGYLPGADVSKIAEQLRKRDVANNQSTTFINSRSTVYGENDKEIGRRAEAGPARGIELIDEIERHNARANGNIKEVR